MARQIRPGLGVVSLRRTRIRNEKSAIVGRLSIVWLPAKKTCPSIVYLLRLVAESPIALQIIFQVGCGEIVILVQRKTTVLRPMPTMPRAATAEMDYRLPQHTHCAAPGKVDQHLGQVIRQPTPPGRR